MAKRTGRERWPGRDGWLSDPLNIGCESLFNNGMETRGDRSPLLKLGAMGSRESHRFRLALRAEGLNVSIELLRHAPTHPRYQRIHDTRSFWRPIQPLCLSYSNMHKGSSVCSLICVQPTLARGLPALASCLPRGCPASVLWFLQHRC
jgi:hypothetical protein